MIERSYANARMDERPEVGVDLLLDPDVNTIEAAL